MENNHGFDRLLEDAVGRACENDWAVLEREMGGFAYTFSEEFERKMGALTGGERKEAQARGKKPRLKYMLIAAAILLINATIVLANPVLWEKLGNLIAYLHGDYIELREEGTADADSEAFHVYHLRYVPEGYTQTGELTDETGPYLIDYEDENGNTFMYAQCQSEGSSVLVTYEDSEEKEIIDLHGVEAWIVSDGEINSLLFELEGYIFTIASQEGREELIKAAESLEVWEKNN